MDILIAIFIIAVIILAAYYMLTKADFYDGWVHMEYLLNQYETEALPVSIKALKTAQKLYAEATNKTNPTKYEMGLIEFYELHFKVV